MKNSGNGLRIIFVLICIFLFQPHVFAQLVINSFSPISGALGSVVTISGGPFTYPVTSNIVYFGSVRAEVFYGTSSFLEVKVPLSATYAPITVTTNNFTAYASTPFLPTFGNGSGLFTANSFASEVNSAVGTGPYEITASDFDQDGKPDVAISNHGGNNISILRNTSTANSISFASKFDYEAGQSPFGIASGDINGDGKPDIILASVSSGQVSVYKNMSIPGNISFAARVIFFAGTLPQNIAVNDIDGDGKPDIVAGNLNAFTISIIRNTSTLSTMSFATPIAYPTDRNVSCLAIGDMDGDTKPDVCASISNSNSVAVFRNTSTPGIISFAPKLNIPAGTFPYHISAGDINGDGKPEIVVANNQTAAISIFKNTSTIGSLSFASGIEYPVGAYPQSTSINDLDGDGLADITVVKSAGVSVVKNNSDNGIISLMPKFDYLISSGPRGISTCDLNGDSKTDIALAGVFSNQVSVLKSNMPVTIRVCPNGLSSLTAPVSGTDYQWQQSTDSVNFSNLTSNNNFTGTNTNMLYIITPPSSWYGYQYRCVVNGISTEPFTLQFFTRWIGNPSSTAWENTSNWLCGILPDSNTDVIINSGSVVLNASTSVRSVICGTGANMTVRTGVVLTVNH